ncbi:uridylate kinase [Purpureocillium lavendulum]|uniref:Uridylate kinase n=1 Tax=Purpureocillium lavendulum TaxID=1247861 RepID=A0AB34G3S5_9HYPO|nr:uridylate kinase [Purpureocillium lavendulum]
MASAREDGANSTAPNADEEEDDYMTMVIQDPVKQETSMQRAARLKRESRQRGVIKSKAQLAQEAEEAREKALSTSLLEGPRSQQSKGLAMMAKMGFTGGGLGKDSGKGNPSGITEPISVTKKEDRSGIGHAAEKRRRAEESGEGQRNSKAVRTADDFDPAEYRDRMSRERLVEKLEKQITAAQRLAASLDDERESPNGGGDNNDAKKSITSRKRLKSYPKEYRAYIRQQQEQDRRRHDRALLATHHDRDLNGDEDNDDITALGKRVTEYVEAEDLDESDEELEEFCSLDAEERLRSIVLYLREQHNYCFWCKQAYPDKSMEGCPGLTEDDHD